MFTIYFLLQVVVNRLLSCKSSTVCSIQSIVRHDDKINTSLVVVGLVVVVVVCLDDSVGKDIPFREDLL